MNTKKCICIFSDCGEDECAFLFFLFVQLQQLSLGYLDFVQNNSKLIERKSELIVYVLICVNETHAS